jgi:hypothetical protein
MPVYNILDFGAAGDGTANDATAIQRAIDACTQAGGEHPPAYFRHALESHAVGGLVGKNFKGISAHPELYPAVCIED